MPSLTTSPTELAYLATPYSHDDPDIRDARFWQAVEAALTLSRKYIVYSSIVQNHLLAIRGGLPYHAAFWQVRNEAMIRKSDIVIFVMFNGHKESKGCLDELLYAATCGKKIWRVRPSEIGLKDILDGE